MCSRLPFQRVFVLLILLLLPFSALSGTASAQEPKLIVVNSSDDAPDHTLRRRTGRRGHQRWEAVGVASGAVLGAGAIVARWLALATSLLGALAQALTASRAISRVSNSVNIRTLDLAIIRCDPFTLHKICGRRGV
ncbi:hypothetical protein HC891_15135 [Candidatus Gracilibacteria bacterium]|nr:hypothetical protein [Candidatus Gracilibacteria bacterium]